MYGFFTFLHIIGLVVWLGLLIAIAITMPILINELDTKVGQKLVQKKIRTFNAMTHLAAIIVLLSGFYRVVQMNFGDATKPFWLNYMEMAGGMTVFLGIILIELLGRRVTKPLGSQKASLEVAVVEKKIIGLCYCCCSGYDACFIRCISC